MSVRQERVEALLVRLRPVLEECMDAAMHSAGDFGCVETAVRAAITQCRPIVVTALLEASVATAARDYRCPVCGRWLSVRSYRERRVVTAEGEGVYRSTRFRCDRCRHDWYPLEEANGLTDGHFTTGAKGVIAQAGAEGAYGEASCAMEERGVPVSAKEVDRIVAEVSSWRGKEEQEAVKAAIQARETGDDGQVRDLDTWAGWEHDTPVCISIDGAKVRSPERGEDGLKWFDCLGAVLAPAWEGSKGQKLYWGGVADPEESFQLLFAHSRSDPRRSRPSLFVADGAPWIWNRAAIYFPKARQVLDIYHAGEHVASAAAACWGEESARAQKWKKRARSMLLTPRGPQRIRRILAYQLEHGKPANRADLQRELRYLQEHRRRMPYWQLKHCNLPVGSGVMESGVKQLSTRRLRQAGMMWTREGADRVLKLRAALLSGCLKETVQRQHRYLQASAARFTPHRQTAVALN